jgi:hypothetical protein
MATPDRQLVFEDFSDKVGQVFTLRAEGLPEFDLILQSAEPLNSALTLPGIRPPFGLSFLAKDPRVLPQHLYQLAHAGLGEVMVFLVPSGKTAAGVTYHATFN